MTNFGLKKAASIILFSSLTSGCALTIPLHEGRTPETLGPKTLRCSLGMGTTATVGTPAGSTTPDEDTFNEQTGIFSALRGEVGLTEQIEMTADYKNVSGGPVVHSEDRSFYGYGGFLGIALSAMYQSFGFEVLAETNIMNMPEVYGSGRTNYLTTNFFISVPFQL